jgi:sec-independent protein translocase protein TatB
VFNLGMGEITVILLLALIFLGPSKLPDLASSLGKLIREVRKATSDVKNEIALDETFRKPFEELRDAVTLHPDELKRRDQWRRDQEEAAKRAAEAAAQAVAAAQKSPDGLDSPVAIQGVSQPALGEPEKAVALPPPGPNDTIVQAAPPRGATLDDVPTPPPEVAPPPPPKLVTRVLGSAPVGTVPRPDTLRGVKPVAPAVATTPVAENGSNVTQILKEEDLFPTASSGPPPPPHLPGLRPASVPAVTPPLPPPAADKKKA